MKMTVDATVDNLNKVLAFIDEQLETNNCPMRVMLEIDVAAEELFVNVASYAYTSGIGSVAIEVNFEEKPKAVAIRFIDSGIPYNPLEKEDPDVTLPAEKRGIGGLGVFMVKKSMDEVTYEYKDGKNHLTIRKFFDRKHLPFMTSVKEKKEKKSC